MDNNLEYYDKLRTPPQEALKKIQAGRLKGKSDINPQWRYHAMTSVFGPIGKGWKFTIDKMWTETGTDGQVFAFVNVSVYVKYGDEWSDAIQGTGGHQLIVKERSGLHNNDEAFKMATTDALSTSLKMIGVAADVYSGFETSKYSYQPPQQQPQQQQQPAQQHAPINQAPLHEDAWDKFNGVKNDMKEDQRQWCVDQLNNGQYEAVINYVEEWKKHQNTGQ